MPVLKINKELLFNNQILYLTLNPWRIYNILCSVNVYFFVDEDACILTSVSGGISFESAASEVGNWWV